MNLEVQILARNEDIMLLFIHIHIHRVIPKVVCDLVVTCIISTVNQGRLLVTKNVGKGSKVHFMDAIGFPIAILNDFDHGVFRRNIKFIAGH